MRRTDPAVFLLSALLLVGAAAGCGEVKLKKKDVGAADAAADAPTADAADDALTADSTVDLGMDQAFDAPGSDAVLDAAPDQQQPDMPPADAPLPDAPAPDQQPPDASGPVACTVTLQGSGYKVTVPDGYPPAGGVKNTLVQYAACELTPTEPMTIVEAGFYAKPVGSNNEVLCGLFLFGGIYSAPKTTIPYGMTSICFNNAYGAAAKTCTGLGYPLDTGTKYTIVMAGEGKGTGREDETSSTYVVIKPAVGRVTYISNKTGKYEVWVMDTDGKNQKQLSTKATGSTYQEAANHPRFSRYGDLIGFHYGYIHSSIQQLNVIKPDGTGFKLVKSGGVDPNVWPTWTLDDRIVYYTKACTCCEKLYEIKPDGTGDILFFGGSGGWQPVYPLHHPMDRKTAFKQYKCGGNDGAICTISDDGTGETCITSPFVSGGGLLMDWSADGSKIMFTVSKTFWSTYPKGLYWIPATGGTPTKIVDAYTENGATFGAQDKEIYYVDKDTSSVSQIFRVDIDGNNKKQITSGTAESKHPNFYPDQPRPDGAWVSSSHNPLFTAGASSAWDARLVDLDVIWDGTEYRMYYSACVGTSGACYPDIGLATSPDGVVWTRYSGNPVIKRGTTSFNNAEVMNPAVVYDGSKYHIWYQAINTYCGIGRIAYASSTDGKTWSHHSSPVITPTQTWEGQWRYERPTVIKDGSLFRMWYVNDGCSGTTCTACTSGEGKVGYAWSSDGKSWTKHAQNPVFTKGASGSWDDAGVGAPEVVKVGSIYHLWYGGASSGNATKFGHATSIDGSTWVRDGQNPVLGPLVGGWKATVCFPKVVQRGSFMQLWHRGDDASAKATFGYVAVAP